MKAWWRVVKLSPLNSCLWPLLLHRGLSYQSICWCHQSRGRGSYMAGAVNSAPLLTVGWKSVSYFPSHFWWPDVPKMHKIAQICTYIFKKFSGGNTLDPQNWGGVKFPSQTPPPRRTPTVPLFQSFHSHCISPSSSLLTATSAAWRTSLDHFCFKTDMLPTWP